MVDIDTSIKMLEKNLKMIKKINKAFYKDYDNPYHYRFQNKIEAKLLLMQKLKIENVDLTKEYPIGNLIFSFEFDSGELYLHARFKEELNSVLCNSLLYNNSQEILLEELQKWVENVLVKDIMYIPLNPLNCNFEYIDLSGANESLDLCVDRLVDLIKITINKLSYPSDKVLWMIDNYVAYVIKKIEWYKEDIESGVRFY